jgi:hypothetical protein
VFPYYDLWCRSGVYYIRPPVSVTCSLSDSVFYSRIGGRTVLQVSANNKKYNLIAKKSKIRESHQTDKSMSALVYVLIWWHFTYLMSIRRDYSLQDIIYILTWRDRQVIHYNSSKVITYFLIVWEILTNVYGCDIQSNKRCLQTLPLYIYYTTHVYKPPSSTYKP